MSTEATKSPVNKSSNPSNPLTSDAGLILRGVVTTQAEDNSFTSPKGTTFKDRKFSVSDGKNTFVCKIESDTGDDYPDIDVFQPIALRVNEAKYDSYNGMCYIVQILK